MFIFSDKAIGNYSCKQDGVGRWLTLQLLNTTDPLTITLAPIVIDELDSHKYNTNRKISKRVKKLLPRIEAIIDNPSLCRYNFIYIHNRPADETFINHKLDRKEQDDCLLATIIEHQLKLDNCDSIILVTNDVGRRLKAKSLAIPTLKLPEEYTLANEPDDLERKNLALQNELSQLKNRIKVILISFKSKTDLLVIKRKPIAYSKDEFIKEQMAKIKTAYFPLVYTPIDKDLYNTPMKFFNQDSLFTLSENQITNYNKDLDEYYEKYEQYIESLFPTELFKYNSIEVQLFLQNVGSSPAIDIDIDLHFPDGFNLCSIDEFPRPMKKPEPPYKPKNQFDINFIMPIPFRQLHSHSKANIGNVDLNASKPSIKKTNSYNVTYHLKNLKHNQTYNLESLFAKYQDINAAKGFKIDYKLIVANIPKVISGQLNVKFE